VIQRVLPKCETNKYGCKLVQHLVPPRSGKNITPQVHLGDGFNKKERITKVAMIAVERYAPSEEKNLQISHLCHNATCINTDHLVQESAEINNSRKNCVGIVEIQLPTGIQRGQVCTHQPPCKKITECNPTTNDDLSYVLGK